MLWTSTYVGPNLCVYSTHMHACTHTHAHTLSFMDNIVKNKVIKAISKYDILHYIKKETRKGEAWSQANGQAELLQRNLLK
jgi:hypothetical protein